MDAGPRVVRQDRCAELRNPFADLQDQSVGPPAHCVNSRNRCAALPNPFVALPNQCEVLPNSCEALPIPCGILPSSCVDRPIHYVAHPGRRVVRRALGFVTTTVAWACDRQ